MGFQLEFDVTAAQCAQNEAEARRLCVRRRDAKTTADERGRTRMGSETVRAQRHRVETECATPRSARKPDGFGLDLRRKARKAHSIAAEPGSSDCGQFGESDAME